ncbi:sensor histidine kinase [Gemmatimonadota bacterium]
MHKGIKLCLDQLEIEDSRRAHTYQTIASQIEKAAHEIDTGIQVNLLKKLILSYSDSEIKLFELNKLKNKFLGIAAHDLRNPLVSIRGFSEILLEEAKQVLDEEQYEFITIINKAANDMLNLVNELLDVSVIESGKLEIHVESRSLKEVLEERVRICQSVAQRKNIQILATYSDIPHSLFDADRINQVVDNLISNAIKFSPPDTEIHISLSQEGEMAKVSVRDQGPGISEEDQAKMFGEFQKLSARPTGDETSTGLGLSIVKKIIDGHKGNIWVESEIGEGSNFIFTLPLEG